MALTDAERLASVAIDCVTAVNRKRLRRAQKGRLDSSSAGIPWSRLLELVSELERQYPGVLDRTYDLIEER